MVFKDTFIFMNVSSQIANVQCVAPARSLHLPSPTCNLRNVSSLKPEARDPLSSQKLCHFLSPVPMCCFYNKNHEQK